MVRFAPSGQPGVRARPWLAGTRAAVLLAAALVCSALPAQAQATGPAVRLVVPEGTPLRVALDHRVIIRRVGQPVEAVLVEPTYAYDRVVIPAGARVLGHVERRAGVSKMRRITALLGGDFTPLHDIWLQFDAVVLPDGRTLPVATHVAAGTGQVTLTLAGAADRRKAALSAANEEAGRHVKDALSTVRGPNRRERAKDAVLRALPYHPEFFGKGTVFSARLRSALDFGIGVPTAIAAPGTVAAPESVLSARLVRAVTSADATAGTPIEAIVTRPVFSAANELIFPAGSTLTGKVTFVKRARRFRRNGQLRLLFDSVRPLDGEPASMLASLHSVEAGRADRLAIDEEGGARTTNSPMRFVAPAIGALSVVGLAQGHLDFDTDGAGPEMAYGGPVSGSVGGLVGASITGVLVSSLGHPAALALASIGVVRSTYTAAIGKGKEVAFPADTRIQVQLSPGPRTGTPDATPNEPVTGVKPGVKR